MKEKKLSDSFLVLSFHYIKQCNDKWISDYWYRRGMASVRMCQDIVTCPEFPYFYESKCRKGSGIWELCIKDGTYRRDMLLGVKLLHGIYYMPPTNRQSLSGLVLSFYANSPKMKKLFRARKAMGLPYYESVGLMIT